MNISEELNILNTAKQDIKSAIIEKGQTVGDNMHEYADAIRNISGGEDTNDYLCFEAVEDSAISLSNYGGNLPNVEYSFDKQTWMIWDYNNIDLPVGLKLYMRGNNPNGFSIDNDYVSPAIAKYSSFVINGNIILSGSLRYLLANDGHIVNIPDEAIGCFSRLFYGDSCQITDSRNLKIDFDKIPKRCFIGMFRRNNNLIYSIELFSTANNEMAYFNMFANSTNIITCAKILPSLLLYKACYNGLYFLTKIKEAPYLPAKTLVSECYGSMFYQCSLLQYIKAEFTTAPSSTYCNAWVSGVPSTGCFIKANNASWTTKGVYACPSGWTLITSVS